MSSDCWVTILKRFMRFPQEHVRGKHMRSDTFLEIVLTIVIGIDVVKSELKGDLKVMISILIYMSWHGVFLETDVEASKILGCASRWKPITWKSSKRLCQMTCIAAHLLLLLQVDQLETFFWSWYYPAVSAYACSTIN